MNREKKTADVFILQIWYDFNVVKIFTAAPQLLFQSFQFFYKLKFLILFSPQLPNDTIIQVWMGDMTDVMRATSLGYEVS